MPSPTPNLDTLSAVAPDLADRIRRAVDDCPAFNHDPRTTAEDVAADVLRTQTRPPVALKLGLSDAEWPRPGVAPEPQAEPRRAARRTRPKSR